MGECIITKLKEATHDQNICKMGEIRFTLSSNKPYPTFAATCRLCTYGKTDITCLTDKFQNDVTNHSIESGYKQNNITPDGTPYISYIDKRNTVMLEGNCFDSVEFALEDLVKYNTAVEYVPQYNMIYTIIFSSKRGNLNGDISAFEKVAGSLRIINIYDNHNGKITGDIEVFRNSTRLEGLSMPESHTYGDITALENKTFSSNIVLGTGHFYGDCSQINAPGIEFRKTKTILYNQSYNLVAHNENNNVLTWEHHNDNPTLLRGANLGGYLNDYLKNIATNISESNTQAIIVYGNVDENTKTYLNQFKNRNLAGFNNCKINDIPAANYLTD